MAALRRLLTMLREARLVLLRSLLVDCLRLSAFQVD